MIRRLALLVLSFSLVAVAIPASAAAAAATKKCTVSKKWDTVAKNSQVIVFTVDRSSGDLTETLFGCYRKTGTRVRLADAMDDGYVTSLEFDHVTVNGRFVAWQWTSTDISCKADCPPDYEATTYAIERADVKTRRTLSWEGRAEGTTLRVSPKGNVAWVQATATAGVFEVRTGDKAGHRAIDTGAIDVASFNLRGTALSWTNGGVPKAATLP